ncbi:MAG: hypothetical protein QOI54_2976 [Actinomycetota bacterium]|jgi:hypothetical protein|nr:hypothetical protein [Actinomycetota bacterium]
MTLTGARHVADAVLYEGYLLYPYRASSAKNQMRWQFGVLGPDGAAEAGVGEASAMSAEMVLESVPGATVDLFLRFLQVQARVVQRHTDRGWEPVDELLVGGTRWVPFHEAVAREVPLRHLSPDELGAGRRLDVSAAAGEDVEELREDGRVVGRLVRTRRALQGTVTVTSRPGSDARLVILGVHTANTTRWSPEDAAGRAARDLAAEHSFVGTHLLVSATGARFVSLLEGPDWATADTSSCAQHRCWPVMVADDQGTDAVLVSPIVLGDHPTIAPESAGDLFDATEIDEILTLRVMTMTEQEKADARGTDPRAAAIVARCDAMSDDALSHLHGARRPSYEAAGALGTEDAVPGDGPELPWWDAGRDAAAEPERDAVQVGGVPVAKGSRVLLRPSRRADAQDLFLAGRTAVVSRVYFDVDGGTHVAVALEDDPASDLYDVTGRFYYFGPEELEALPARDEAR